MSSGAETTLTQEAKDLLSYKYVCHFTAYVIFFLQLLPDSSNLIRKVQTYHIS